MEIDYFTPGRLAAPGPPLALYRSPSPVGALEPYLDAYTRPGDLVIDLFGSRPTFVHEAVRAGRRALGVNVNRAFLLAAALGLTEVERHAVEAAFTRLAESSKGPQTLQAHIEGLYRTTCAACGAELIADAFVWERDGEAPVAKRYRCACGDGQPTEALTDAADRAAVARFERRGLSYWLMLDRAAPRAAPHRERVAPMLELYTPRNLSALGDLLLKSDGLALDPPVRQVLDALLVDTLDRAASLRAPDAPLSRPRRLQRPARYVEMNVWRLFEGALEVWRSRPPTPVPLVASPDELLTSAEACAALVSLSSAQVGHTLPAGCAALILVDPPRPDTVLWHLSALWNHWLWGPEAAAPLTPLLSRRWLDKEWLWRGLRGALGAVSPLLRPDGRLICLFTDEKPAILEAMTLAAASAGYELVGWGARATGETRLTWRFDRPPDVVAVEVDALSRQVAERGAVVGVEAVRARGEPADWPTLHAAIYTGLAGGGALARVASLPDEVADPLSWLADNVRAALDGAPLRQLPNEPTDEMLWWLADELDTSAELPLCDRVELAVAEILQELLAVEELDLRRRVCARFPGPQTPPGHLIRLCLFSYGDEHAPGHWRLRAEDDFAARAAETDAIIADLRALGQRLGYDVRLGASSAGEWAVRWMGEGEHTVYAFAVRATAVLGDLLLRPPVAEARPCLVLPGGRAILVGYKLRHDPRLRQQAEGQGWQFLKFRHLRHLVEKAADRYAFQAALGLDPIVEQDEAQMSLW